MKMMSACRRRTLSERDHRRSALGRPPHRNLGPAAVWLAGVLRQKAPAGAGVYSPSDVGKTTLAIHSTRRELAMTMPPDAFHQARQGMFAPVADGVTPTASASDGDGDGDADDGGQATTATTGSSADPDWNAITSEQKSAVNHPGS